MITNFNSQNRAADIKALKVIIAIFLFVVWLCTPPGNKFMQICFWGNNTQYFVAKMTVPESVDEWIFHRNNAIYLAGMDNKKASMIEMNKALATIPTYASDKQLSDLYKDRAQLRIYFKDYKGALNDYARVSTDLSMTDRLKVAVLYKVNGNNKYALSYCNSILDVDPQAYAGYACIADIYDFVGRPDASVKVYDLLIDRVPNRAKYYADRALFKQKAGDADGYNQDMNKAKELSPSVNTKFTLIEDTLYPKKLTLQAI